jgi:hypothetical protein
MFNQLHFPTWLGLKKAFDSELRLPDNSGAQSHISVSAECLEFFWFPVEGR